jgi:hypothetical protein
VIYHLARSLLAILVLAIVEERSKDGLGQGKLLMRLRILPQNMKEKLKISRISSR